LKCAVAPPALASATDNSGPFLFLGQAVAKLAAGNKAAIS
jgi:hypothetical protein